MIFRKVVALILSIILLVSNVAIADQQTAEQKAEEIFNSLTETFDTGLNYLKHRQALWSSFVEASEMAFPADMKWFWNVHVLLGSTQMAFPITMFYMNHFHYVDVSDVTYDNIYDEMFMPLYRQFGETKEGFQKACFALIHMIFYGNDSDRRQELTLNKDKIKSLAQEYPDYEYNTSLKTFYKECLQLLDYIADSSDNYTQAKEQVSLLEQKKRELKSEFDFDFEWKDLEMTHIVGISDTYYIIYHPDAENNYRLANEKASKGDLLNAFSIYQEILSYKDSGDSYVIIRKTLYEQALNYENQGMKEKAASIYKAIQPYQDSTERYQKNASSLLSDPIRLEGFTGLCGAFFHGLAPIQDMKGKWGFVNTAGIIVIGCQYDSVTDFWSGYSTVSVNTDGTEKKGVIDPSGNYTVPVGEFDDIGTFSLDGLCAVKEGEKWGYIDTSGNIVIPARYDKATYFNEGYASVQFGKDWGVINTAGETVIEPRFGTGFLFRDGIAAVLNNGRFIYIDTTGKQLFNSDYAAARDFNEDLAVCMDKVNDERYRCIDLNGQTIFTLECNSMGVFQEGLNWFKQENKLGIVDKTGYVIISPEYSDFRFVGKGFNEGYIAAKKNDKWGAINQNNLVIIPLEYDDVYSFNEGYAIAIQGNTIHIFSTQ